MQQQIGDHYLRTPGPWRGAAGSVRYRHVTRRRQGRTLPGFEKFNLVSNYNLYFMRTAGPGRGCVPGKSM